MKALSWINCLLGLWLIVSAFILSTGATAIMTEEIVLGIIIAVLAYASALVRPSSILSWIVALAGLWTLAAPFVIDYAARSASRGNDMIVGVIVLVLGFANAIYRQSPTRTAA